LKNGRPELGHIFVDLSVIPRDFKSSFLPQDDDFAVSAIGAIAVAPSDPTVVYVGTPQAREFQPRERYLEIAA